MKRLSTTYSPSRKRRQKEMRLEEISRKRGSVQSDRSKNSSKAAKQRRDCGDNDRDDSLCSFCQHRPAALLVKLPDVSQEHTAVTTRLMNNGNKTGGDRKTTKQKFIERRLCLLHYYTTSAVRVAINTPSDNPSSDAGTADGDAVTVINASEFDRQRPEMQSMFADVFVELQKELSEESARAFAATSKDPLAILNTFSRKPTAPTKTTTRKIPPPSSLSAASAREGDRASGGFLKDVPIPERIRRTQQQQAQKQLELTKRMDLAQKQLQHQQQQRNSKQNTNKSTQRRKPTRQSIWNAVIDDKERDGKDGKDKKGSRGGSNDAANTDETSFSFLYDDVDVDGVECTSCKSTKVETVGTGTSRNQDMAKGEIWGTKDRGDEVITRYRCLDCGKTWNAQ